MPDDLLERLWAEMITNTVLEVAVVLAATSAPASSQKMPKVA